MKIVIDNSFSFLSDIDLSKEEINVVDKACTITYPTYKWDFTEGRYITTGFEHKQYYDKNSKSFPTGWIEDVRNSLKLFNNKIELEDIRPKPKHHPIEYAITDKYGNPAISRYYQDRAFELSIKRTRGVIHHPTRSGKTTTMALIAFEVGHGVLVLVNDTTVLNQSYKVMRNWAKDKNDVGIIGGSKWKPSKITVATVQTLVKRIDQEECTRFLKGITTILLDEAHHINFSSKNLYNSYFAVTQACVNAYYRIGFTASPGTERENEFRLLRAATGKIFDFVSIKELQDKGYLVRGTVLMPVINHSSVYKYAPQAKLQGVYNNVRRNAAIKRIVDLCEEAGKLTLISCKEIEQQGKVLENMFGNTITSLYGKDENNKKTTKKVREAILDKFESREITQLISTLLNEGVDLPAVDVVVNASANAKDKMTTQIAGRVLTINEGKDSALVIDPFDMDDGLLEKWSNNRLKVYKKLNFKIKVLELDEIKKYWDDKIAI